MVWTIIFYLILLICVIHLCSKAYKFIPLSKFHHFYVPVYSIILFLITFSWTDRNDYIAALILLPISLLIGWYQSSKLEVKKKYSEKKKKMQYFVKRNHPFVIGWILLLVIGIGIGELNTKTSVVSALSEKIFTEILSEFDPLLIFTEHHPWYIWFMSGISSLTFSYCAQKKIDEKEQNHELD